MSTVHYPKLCVASWETEEEVLDGFKSHTMTVKHICKMGEHTGDHVCTCGAFEQEEDFGPTPMIDALLRDYRAGREAHDE